jgi:hypothetical protein
MADAWQSAWVEVLPDFSNFRREASPSIVSILGDAGDEGGRSGSKSFGNSFIGGVGKLAAPIAGAFAALGIGNLIGDAVRTGIDYVSEGVNLASDLAESVNAVEVSYGSASTAILALGENSADSMALTRAELNSAAVQFSSFSKTIAGDGGDVANTFSSIAQRGVDFASVMNLDVSEALTLFQSGLAGETEPLRRFGIDVSAAAVEQYALATGIAASASSMTEAQKVQARYGLLMQATSQYAGDFANTQDGAANASRRLTASLAEVQTSAGEIFLPLVTQLANVANDELVPALADVIQKSGPELAASLAESVPSLVSFLETLIPMLPQLLKLGTDALPLFISGMTLLLPAIEFVTKVQNDWVRGLSFLFALIQGDTTLDDLHQTVQGLQGPFGLFRDIVANTGNTFASFGQTVAIAATSLGTNVANGVNTAVSFIQSLPQRAVAALGNVGNLLYNSGRSLIGGWIDGIRDMMRPAGDAVAGVIGWVRGFFPNSPAERGPLSGSGWNSLAESGAAVMTQFTSGFARPDLTGSLTPALAAVRPAVTSQYASSATIGSPRELVIVDADRHLIGRMRVEADGRVGAHAAAEDTKWSSGGKSL